MTSTPIVLSVMNSLLAFTFGDMEVRAVIIDGQFWFVADDVCEALGIQDKTEALAILEPDKKRIVEFYIAENHERSQMLMMNKQGLFVFTVSQDIETAKAFEHWIVYEVLPALNKLAEYEPDNHETPIKNNEINIQATKNWLELLEAENDTLTDEARTNIATDIFRLITGRDVNCSIKV